MPARPGSVRKVFTLLVEMRCNSYCVFCGEREIDEAVVRTRRRLGLIVPETNTGHLRDRYTLESATAALVKAHAEGFTDLSLQGGEPTIFPDIVELVRRAQGLGFAFVGLVTNGRKLADRAFTEALLGAGLDGITLSILGPDAETHDALAAAPGSFEALVAGLGHAVEVARALDRRLRVNANVIVSGRSVDRLAETVRVLGARGVHAGVLHLVRFHHLGSDPGVVGPLRFPIGRLRPALAAAMEEAKRVGFSLHASDVPLCLHPRLAAAELRLIVREHEVQDHRFQGAGHAHGVSKERPVPPACAGCLLVKRCRFVPDEYLAEAGSGGLAPITPEGLVDRVDAALAAIRPADPGAAAELSDLADALRMLGAVTGDEGAVRGPIARLREALRDLVLIDFQRRDGARLLTGFCGLLGLRVPTKWTMPEDGWDRCRMPVTALAASVGAVSAERAPRGPRLWIGDRFAIAFEGARRDGAVIEATAVRPIVAEATTAADHVLRALFLMVVAPGLRGARRLRVTEGAIEIETEPGSGFAPAWALAWPGAARVAP